jgi:hypothetical protein
MKHRPIIIATAILVAPLFIGMAGLFFEPLEKLLRDYFNTHAGRLINTYSTVLLGIFAGSLWAFAALNPKNEFTPHFLSLVSIFLILSMYSIDGAYRAFALIAFFILLLPIDYYFKKHALAPTWWLGFKFPLTMIVILCVLTRRFINLVYATLALT